MYLYIFLYKYGVRNTDPGPEVVAQSGGPVLAAMSKKMKRQSVFEVACVPGTSRHGPAHLGLWASRSL